MRLANWITIATPRNEANELTKMYAINPHARGEASDHDFLRVEPGEQDPRQRRRGNCQDAGDRQAEPDACR
jgi:hypothetical protein